MNHLTEEELLDYVDGRASQSAMRTAEEHCRRCAHCRQRAEFERSLSRAASVAPPTQLSEHFTERVMRASLAERRTPRFAWLLHNSASFIAMAAVLGILAAVGSLTGLGADAGPESASPYLRIFTLWSTASESAASGLSRAMQEMVKPVVSQTGSVFGSVFWIGVAALLLFGFADRLRMKFISTR
ncbi:MAG: anti-sigma factor family protein [Acidobacteriota bacterium]